MKRREHDDSCSSLVGNRAVCKAVNKEMDAFARSKPGCAHQEPTHGPAYWKEAFQKHGCDGMLAAIGHSIDDLKTGKCPPLFDEMDLIDAAVSMAERCPSRALDLLRILKENSTELGSKLRVKKLSENSKNSTFSKLSDFLVKATVLSFWTPSKETAWIVCMHWPKRT